MKMGNDMKFYIIAFTSAGIRLGIQMKQIKKRDAIEEIQLFGWHKYGKENVDEGFTDEVIPFYSTKQLVKSLWKKENFILFIGATGIAVRSIAPFLIDKTCDPAVLVMDDTGTFIISLLSGHLGGANEFCEQLAKQFHATPVITTATDRNHCFAVDLFAKKNNLWIVNWHTIKAISGRILEGKSVGLISEYKIEGMLPNGLADLKDTTEREVGITVMSKLGAPYFKEECRLLPKNLVVGIGCKKGKKPEELRLFLEELLLEYELPKQRVQLFVSIDRKKEEPAILDLAEKWEVPFWTYTAEELNGIKGDFEESEFVQQTVGVSNVCERSAYIGSHYGKKLVGKHTKDGMALAIYEKEMKLTMVW